MNVLLLVVWVPIFHFLLGNPKGIEEVLGEIRQMVCIMECNLIFSFISFQVTTLCKVEDHVSIFEETFSVCS